LGLYDHSYGFVLPYYLYACGLADRGISLMIMIFLEFVGLVVGAGVLYFFIIPWVVAE